MYKTAECKSCGTLVKNVSVEAPWVVCWECVAESVTILDPPKTKKKTVQGYPKGWRFMKEFVHSNGTVYHKGVEQPQLKDTLQPTTITVKPKKNKIQKQQERDQVLTEYAELKKSLKKETRKTVIKKIEVKLKKLQKQL